MRTAWRGAEHSLQEPGLDDGEPFGLRARSPGNKQQHLTAFVSQVRSLLVAACWDVPNPDILCLALGLTVYRIYDYCICALA